MITIDLDTARRTLREDYITNINTAKNDEIHVYPHPPGTGKTKTFATLIEEILNIIVLTLVPTHDLAKETEEHYDVHLKGRDYFDCPRRGIFEETNNINFNRFRVICRDCVLRITRKCEYLKNVEQALKSRTVISVHDYLNYTIPYGFLRYRHKKCILVIDESPINSLIKQVHITTKDLNNMRAIIEGSTYFSETDKELFSGLTNELSNSIKTEKSYYNRDFLRKFKCKPEYQDIPFSDIKKLINQFNEHEDTGYIHNFIDELTTIVELSIKHKGRNVALPFAKPERYIRKEQRSIPMKEITYTSINRELPKVPVILFDATADKTLLEKIFPDRKIIMHNPQIKSTHIPYQITDGNYARKALSKERTRKRILESIL